MRTSTYIVAGIKMLGAGAWDAVLSYVTVSAVPESWPTVPVLLAIVWLAYAGVVAR
ncbi:hypothetical protein [Halosegnis sp.]|uniref:hypothetical protein n=1 Tax=Halosegnis sp. TaxID=2864959 RepID=UPI0035D49E71